MKETQGGLAPHRSVQKTSGDRTDETRDWHLARMLIAHLGAARSGVGDLALQEALGRRHRRIHDVVVVQRVAKAVGVAGFVGDGDRGLIGVFAQRCGEGEILRDRQMGRGARHVSDRALEQQCVGRSLADAL